LGLVTAVKIYNGSLKLMSLKLSVLVIVAEL